VYLDIDTLQGGMTMSKDNTDSLIKSAQQGDKNALDKLIIKYDDVIARYAFSFARNYDIADEVAQISRLKIMRSIDSFNGKAYFTTWAYVIVKHAYLDYIKDLKSRKELYISEIMEFYNCFDEDAIETPISEAAMIVDEPIINQIIEKEEQDTIAKHVNSALDTIPKNFRIPIELQFKEDMKYEEMAEITKVPMGTVKSRIHKGKSLIKERLINYGYDSPKQT
jgi:RNA polymerase sigma-70 factor (ECF subfamily)